MEWDLQDPIIVLSSDYHVVDCNQAAIKIAKYPSKVWSKKCIKCRVEHYFVVVFCLFEGLM